MAVGVLPALGSLTSLTNGGAFTAPTPTTAQSEAVSGVGPVNIGGLNVPALPGDNRALLIGAVIIGAAFIFSRRRRR